ncbi:MAG: YkgJ family cysteine cluster protein, partial [Bacteroidetes bacterium]|nr:YkgJ family cysteine cluster protein [Bacteroidota bacterium]
MQLQTNLKVISNFAVEYQNENDQFAQTLLSLDSDKLDAVVSELNDIVTPQVDCTSCGNCCKSLMINVSDTEADNVAEHLNIPRKKFDDLYIETSLGGKMIINTIPCHFLNNNTCTVYEHRFAGCREFPALHLPQFKDRLFTIFMHYDRCPI